MYMAPFSTVFQYRRFYASNESMTHNLLIPSALPAVMHSVMSEKQDYSLVAVCLSLICTLLSANCDDMTAWLERDGNPEAHIISDYLMFDSELNL